MATSTNTKPPRPDDVLSAQWWLLSVWATPMKWTGWRDAGAPQRRSGPKPDSFDVTFVPGRASASCRGQCLRRARKRAGRAGPSGAANKVEAKRRADGDDKPEEVRSRLGGKSETASWLHGFRGVSPPLAALATQQLSRRRKPRARKASCRASLSLQDLHEKIVAGSAL